MSLPKPRILYCVSQCCVQGWRPMEEEEPRQRPVPSRAALIQPLLRKRKAAPKCGICNRGFQFARKTHIKCCVCSTFYHHKHFGPSERSLEKWHCPGCQRPSSSRSRPQQLVSTPDITEPEQSLPPQNGK